MTLLAPRARRLVFIALLLAVVFAVAPVALGRWEMGGRDPSHSLPVSDLASASATAGQRSMRGPADAHASDPVSQPTQPAQGITLTPLGHLAFDAGFNGDVWGHKGFAYIGTWGTGAACPATGVKIVDLSDPAAPRLVSTAAAIPGATQEDVVVRSVTTPFFTGDLLVVGIQSCNGPGRGGLAVYDVTDPYRPTSLAFFATPGARGVHELDLVHQGERVLALLAVPNSEIGGGPGDFRIVDLTDPRQPVQLAAWGARTGLGIPLPGGIGCTRQTYDHSARASADGTRAYLSYWDAGVIVLDISNPSAPRVLGRLSYPEGEEGSTHSVAPSADGRLLLVADEDTVFSTPRGLRFRVETADGAREVRGCEATFSSGLDQAGVIDGRLVAGGTACSDATLPAGVQGAVVVVGEGGCPASQKAARAAGAGARAVIVGTSGEPEALSGVPAGIPVVIVGDADAAALQQMSRSPGAAITLPVDRRWSGLRIWDIADPNAPRQVAVYQTPGSLAFPPPTDGYYTVHNVEVRGALAFASWWSDGVRVIDLSDPAHPQEVASYVPPAARNPQRIVFPDQTMVWGVALMDDLVLLSDVNSGLHVLRVSTGS